VTRSRGDQNARERHAKVVRVRSDESVLAMTKYQPRGCRIASLRSILASSNLSLTPLILRASSSSP